ncbi:MAG TPA: MCE family protein, partial [Aeromicrobium sp.]|nr:MCE family protein [Aeromicrobium sp.]
TGLDDGTVIASHRVDTSVELELILTRLSSILTAVQPQDLNATLNAVATALSGNGDDIGDAMEKLDAYLKVMNPHLPKLKRDLTRLADVAETYDMAAPDLLDALENATTTARTVTDKKSDLGDALEGLTKVANNAGGLLRENERAILIEGKLAVPLLNLLAFYSPEYQCLFGGMNKSIPALDGIFRNSRVNQTMTFGGTQRPAYQVKDRPEWNGTWRGPSCLGLPGNPIIGRPQMLDGTEDNPFQYYHQAPDNPPKYFFETVGAN